MNLFVFRTQKQIMYVYTNLHVESLQRTGFNFRDTIGRRIRIDRVYVVYSTTICVS